MSGPAALPDAADDLVLDAGVLSPQPCAEIGGYHAVERHGGLAVLRWRGAFLAAGAAGVAAAPVLDAEQRFAQVVVRISRGQAATAYDLAAGLRALAPAGRLVVVGANGLGAATWIKRMAASCGEPLTVITRAKSRLAVFAPTRPPAAPVLPAGEDERRAGVEARDAGLFNGGALDAGTALLVDYLQDPEEQQLFARDAAEARQAAGSPEVQPGAERLVLDLGCGLGALAISQLQADPALRAVLCDADHHALSAASERLRGLGLLERARLRWWDAFEALPEQDVDLVLINPPAHAGLAVDLAAGFAMVAAGLRALRAGGRLLLVVNQRLPYERELARAGPWRLAQQRDGYKILEVRGAPAHG